MTTAVHTVATPTPAPLAGDPTGGGSAPAAPHAPYTRPTGAPPVADAASHGRPPSAIGTEATVHSGSVRDAAPSVAFEIPPEVLKPELWCRRTERPVCIRWCPIHSDYWLFGKPRSEPILAWHGLRRATAHDVAAFKTAIAHNILWVHIAPWEHQRGGPVDRSFIIGRFQGVADRACAEILSLSNFWDAHRAQLPIDVQLLIARRLKGCLAGINAYTLEPEAMR